MIKIALPNKGALSEQAVAIAKEAGYKCSRYGKELCITDVQNDVEFFFLRPRDIAVYVSRGVIDVGITGRDLNLDAEHPALEVMGLGFGGSTFRYAVPNDSDLTPNKLEGKRIACSYANIVKRDLEARGINAQVVRVDGAVEVSIRLGVADAVADVVESGRTLKDAGLKVTGDTVMTSEAIVVARDAATAESEQVVRFLKRINGIVLAREYVMIEYDIQKDKLESATVLTPGIEAPTVAPLQDPAWVAVKSMIKKKGLNTIVDQLAELGAKGIVVMDIRTCRL